MNTLEKMQHYRNIFFSPSGKVVLADLMKHGYFFNSGNGELTADMPEAIGKRNLVNYILTMLSCIDDNEITFMAVINGFEKLPILSKPKQGEENLYE